MIKVVLKILEMKMMEENLIYNRLFFLLIVDLKIDFMKNSVLGFQKIMAMQGNQLLKAQLVLGV